MYDILIVGGGAAGFYAAIHAAEASPKSRIAILERGRTVLSKVKISGGGRCNVTHAEFIPKELAKNYPRGQKELLGPFHTYASGDTVNFFDQRGIPLKIEEDGRIFPTTDSSQTIIDCFLTEIQRLEVALFKNTSVTDIKVMPGNDFPWEVHCKNNTFKTKKLLLATGSNTKIWELLAGLGHTIIDPVPSLFTFNISDPRISNIPGVSTLVDVEVLPKTMYGLPSHAKKSTPPVLQASGPLLITHWGMSGPAILKLSAWGARILHQYNYQFKIKINWVPEFQKEGLLALLIQVKAMEKKTIIRTKVLDLPKRLWANLVKASDISDGITWQEVTKHQLQVLAEKLTESVFLVKGKSTFKEEFVTAGGIELKEVNFKTFESKKLPGLYFAGEILNIDAITGGFNFQNAWTGAYIAAQAMTKQ